MMTMMTTMMMKRHEKPTQLHARDRKISVEDEKKKKNALSQQLVFWQL